MNVFKNLFSPYRGLPKEVYIIFVARIINAVGCFVMPLLTIILTQSIGVSNEAAGYYISLAGLLYMPASLLGGKLADHVGRKKVIVLFDALAAALYILAGLIKPSMDTVYLVMLAGAGMSAAGPAHDSLLADMTTPQNRQGAYGLSYLGWNMGFSIGPVLGGILYRHHLPLVFIGDGLTALLSLSLIMFFVKETVHRAKTEEIGPERSLERREKGSLLAVLRKRPVLIYFAFIIFGYNFAYSQWGFLLPLQIMRDFNQAGPAYFGLIAGFNGLVVMLFTPLITKLSDGVEEIRRMVVGGVLYALGFGMLGILNSLPVFFLSAFIFTLGEIVLAISVTPFIANRTPASHRGRMNAAIPVIMGLGHTLGPAVMGKVLTWTTVEGAWLLVGLVALVAALFMRRLEKADHAHSACGAETGTAQVR